MLARKAKRKYWTGLHERHIRSDNNGLYKPDLIFVKEEGAWVPACPNCSPRSKPHTPHLLTLKPRKLPLILQHPPASTPNLCYTIQNNHKHHFNLKKLSAIGLFLPPPTTSQWVGVAMLGKQPGLGGSGSNL